MQQTAQQLRLGGIIALGIGILNLLIFATLALAEHNRLFFLAALAPGLISSATGVAILLQANQLARTGTPAVPAAPAKAKVPATRRQDAQAIRTVGNVFLATGGGILVVFTLLAIITHIASFFFTTVAPGIIFLSMGLLYVLTSDPGKRR